MSKRSILPAEALSGDTQSFFDVLNNEPDFSVVVVSCAYLDACLGSLLSKHFLDSEVSRKLLDPRSGSLGSFSARTDACYALGLISKLIYQDLVVLAEIRNHVAHHHLMTTFLSPGIAEACARLKFAEAMKDQDDRPLFKPGQLTNTRDRFVMNTVCMSQRLLLIALGVKQVQRAP